MLLIPDQVAAVWDDLDRCQTIAGRADQLDSGTQTCLNPTHPLSDRFWESGARAFREDVLLEECPWNSGPEQDDWLRGWMAAELIEFGQFDDDLTDTLAGT